MITQKEKAYLRDLAKKQRDISELPDMAEKKKLWYAHHECRAERPVFTTEIYTFLEELLPPLFCETPEGRRIERQIRTELIIHEYINDDHVVAGDFWVAADCDFVAFDTEPERVDAYASDGRKTHGYRLDIVINDLERDFSQLKRSRYFANVPAAGGYFVVCQDAFGDILDVRYGYTFGFSLSRCILKLLGMEGMMLALYDCPDKISQALRMLTDDLLLYMRLLEDKRVLTFNHDNTGVGQGTRGFTTQLPAPDFKDRSDKRVLFRDVWGQLDSQETTAVSPAMFEEIFFPYYKEIAEQFGLLSYGCCEAVHEIWDSCLSKLGNLKKLSVSPWCDERFIGERLRGTNIIYHRKPQPNFLGIAPVFDEPAFRAHLLETIQAAAGCTLEFSYRDVYSLQGDPYRAKRAYSIAMDMFEKHWRPV